MKKFKYALTCFVAFFAWKAFFSTDIAKETLKEVVTPSNQIEVSSLKYLSQVAIERNKSLPISIDNGTIFEHVKAESGKLIYQYRLASADSNINNLSEFNRNLKSIMIKQTCSNKGPLFFLDNNVVLVFSYFDKNGVYVGSTSVDRTDC